MCILLEPAIPITDPNVVIGKVGQQNVLPNHLNFKRGDFNPTEIFDAEGNLIGDLIPPGLSGFLFFELHTERDELKTFASKHLGKNIHTKSRLHIAQVGDITQAGWTVYYAPLISQRFAYTSPLHVVITPNSLKEAPKIIDPTVKEREALARVFVRYDYK